MHVFVRKFSIFSLKSFAILSPVSQLLEGHWVPATRQVGFPKTEIPVSPDSEALGTAQFSRIYSKTKGKNSVSDIWYMFCVLETKSQHSWFIHQNLDQSVYQGCLLIAASTNEKFIAASDCKGISVILMISEWLVTRINTFWEKHKLCPTV